MQHAGADDTDLEVTLSEVRPNGTEVYVQSGWLRASHRKLDAAGVDEDLAGPHRPARPTPVRCPRVGSRKVRVELFPFAQPFRAGSRIRITVDAPGGARPLWAFDTIAHGERVTIATDKQHRSRLVLPVVAGIKVPAVRRPAGRCAASRAGPTAGRKHRRHRLYSDSRDRFKDLSVRVRSTLAISAAPGLMNRIHP